MAIEKQSFGLTKSGKETFLYTLSNANGMKAMVSDFGAELVKLFVPNQGEGTTDVVLGGETVSDYEGNGGSLGATVGRSANRIANAKFTINGKEYHIPANENGNNLHSGPDVYNERIWAAEVKETEEGSSVTFTLNSPDGDQGYPGNLVISVTYTVTADNALKIHYVGKADQDTIVNLTNHSYFNLAGHNSGLITDHEVWIDADYFTEADGHAIPTGRLLPVQGTPMDFTEVKVVGKEIGRTDYEPIKNGGGYDHNYCLNAYDTKADKHEIALVASCRDPKTGRKMEVFTDLPGLQLYTGNFLGDEYVGKGGYVYHNRMGICFETQYYPNSVNEPAFPSPVLKAGDTYDTTTIYKFSI